MVLLLVLTLLAISTMSTASLEVTMAGNEQYGENAFQLAETAIEEHMGALRADGNCWNEQNPTVCDIPVRPAPAGMAGSLNTVTARTALLPACANSSEPLPGEIKKFGFQITATGTSSDSALSSNSQGWVFCKP